MGVDIAILRPRPIGGFCCRRILLAADRASRYVESMSFPKKGERQPADGCPQVRRAEFIHDFLRGASGLPPTPFYLIDEARLRANLEIIRAVRERSGAKSVLALKCFSAWSVFPLMREYLDGTTSSSLFEARLGQEKFGKETHAYSVAFADDEIEQLRGFASKIIFNSVSQLKRHRGRAAGMPLGLRVQPGVSHSHFDLADPARPHSRLGARDRAEIEEVLPLLSGLMFHCQCENDDFASFARILAHVGAEFGPWLERMEWVSLGGGVSFTGAGYPLDDFCGALAGFSRRYGVQIYLEPGEAAVAGAGFLVARVLDVVRSDADVAIVDAGVEPHMLDHLIYGTSAPLAQPEPPDGREYQIAGRTCLAGDVFGTYRFPGELRPGDLVVFADAAGYTMVKKNWFNGLPMPAIAVRRLDGTVDFVRSFSYADYLCSLS